VERAHVEAAGVTSPTAERQEAFVRESGPTIPILSWAVWSPSPDVYAESVLTGTPVSAQVDRRSLERWLVANGLVLDGVRLGLERLI